MNSNVDKATEEPQSTNDNDNLPHEIKTYETEKENDEKEIDEQRQPTPPLVENQGQVQKEDQGC